MWLWGNNDNGQIGDGTLTQKRVPKLIDSTRTYLDMANGYRHTMILRSDNTLWAAGANVNGQLGDGTIVPKYEHIKVECVTLNTDNNKTDTKNIELRPNPAINTLEVINLLADIEDCKYSIVNSFGMTLVEWQVLQKENFISI
ncbi:MAG: hypothetical protein IPG87_01965 [Saprospiraceae bacterium]|nr:hypothetical protein [Candidatus Vicinibacter affinis]